MHAAPVPRWRAAWGGHRSLALKRLMKGRPAKNAGRGRSETRADQRSSATVRPGAGPGGASERGVGRDARRQNGSRASFTQGVQQCRPKRRGGTAAAGSKPACGRACAAAYSGGVGGRSAERLRQKEAGRVGSSGTGKTEAASERFAAPRRDEARGSVCRRLRASTGRATGWKGVAGEIERGALRQRGRVAAPGAAPCTCRRASSGRRRPPPLHTWHGLRPEPLQVLHPSPSADQRVHAQDVTPLPLHTGHASCAAASAGAGAGTARGAWRRTSVSTRDCAAALDSQVK